MSVKRGVSVALALAVGGALFYFAFRDVPFAELRVQLSKIRWWWLPILLVLPAMDIMIRSWRWRLLLTPIAKASYFKVFQLEAIGLAVNNVLFMRLGELARGFIGGQELSARTIAVLASIVVERLCDTLAILILLVVSSLAIGSEMDPKLVGMIAAVAFGITVALVVITVFGERILKSPWLVRLKSFPKLWAMLEDLVTGTQAMRSPRIALYVALSSFALWLCAGSLFWAVAMAMQLDPEMSFAKAFVVISTVAASSALPAVPGAFGNFEAGVKLVLVHFGYGKAVSLSYATFVHLVQYTVVTSMGIAFFYRLGHTFSGLKKAIEKR